MKLLASDDFIFLLEEASLYLEAIGLSEKLDYALHEAYALSDIGIAMYFSHYQAQIVADSFLELAYAFGCYSLPRFDDRSALYSCIFYDLYVSWLAQTSARRRDKHDYMCEFIVRHRSTGYALLHNPEWY